MLNKLFIEGTVSGDLRVDDDNKGGRFGLFYNVYKKNGDEWVQIPHFFNCRIWFSDDYARKRATEKIKKGTPIRIEGYLYAIYKADAQEKISHPIINVQTYQKLDLSNGQQSEDKEPIKGDFLDGVDLG